MATRATYQIDRTTFYCHWDGYPVGAAVRFVRMVRALTAPETGRRHLIDAVRDVRGGPAYAFIRGNADAEPAHDNNHAGHGDTEWRYTLRSRPDGRLLIDVYERTDPGGTERWDKVNPVDQDLADWIAETAATAREWDLPRIVRVTCDLSYSPTQIYYAAEPDALEIAGRYEAMAAHYAAGPLGDANPNVANHLRQARDWYAAANTGSTARAAE